MKYKAYPSYKDSGVEWLGKVPEHWIVAQCGRIGVFTSGAGFPHEYQNQTENNIAFYKVGDLSQAGSDGFMSAPSHTITVDTAIHLKAKIFEKGTIVFAKVGAALLLQRYRILRRLSCLDNNMMGLQLNVKNNIRYLYYVLPMIDLNFIVNPGAIPSINEGQISSVKVAIPPLFEQQQIAAFLDKSTGKIDELISKQERLINLLGEKRQAMISQAVTKGLNPNAPMKDSGIEWLGKVPEHWEVKPLRFIGSLVNGVSKGAEYFGSGYPFISYGDVYNNDVIPTLIKRLAKSSLQDRIAYSVKKGDVFFTRTSETVDDIGIASTCLEDVPNAIFSGFIIRFRQFRKILKPSFARYQFRTGYSQSYFEKEMNLVTRASLGQDLLKRLPIIVPPLPEQQQIADYLDEKTAKLDALVEKAKKQIELLKEKRTALISAAVTGKIDVREIA